MKSKKAINLAVQPPIQTYLCLSTSTPNTSLSRLVNGPFDWLHKTSSSSLSYCIVGPENDATDFVISDQLFVSKRLSFLSFQSPKNLYENLLRERDKSVKVDSFLDECCSGLYSASFVDQSQSAAGRANYWQGVSLSRTVRACSLTDSCIGIQ